MDMKGMMGAAQNVWETLDKMQQEDPSKYQEMVKESMQWNEKTKSQPEPCMCLEVRTKGDLTCFVNLLTWGAVAEPDYTSTQPSLPIAGGQQTFSLGNSVFSVCLNPSVLVNPDKSLVAADELENIAKLVIKFLHQVHPGLHLYESYRRLKNIHMKGDLVKIREDLQRMRNKSGQLKTGTPSSLISQLTEVCKQDDGENGEICLPAQQKTKKTGNKLLIEEITGDKKKTKNKSDDFFGKNLQRAFNDKNQKKRSENDKKNEEIKIRQEETFLKEVKTTRLNKEA